MNKRIFSLLLCLVLLLSVIPTAAPAQAASGCVVTVKADKSSVKPGDTVTFTVYVQSSIEIYGAQLFLDIPQGLTYVPGSGAMIPGVDETLGIDGDCSWTEGSMQIILAASEPLSNIQAEALAVATFQCKVDANATGTLTVNTTTNHNGIQNLGGFTVLDGYLLVSLPASEYSLVGAEISVQTEPVFYATVTANKAEAASGDEISFTVSVQSSVDVYGIYLLMDIPQGLSYVPGSGAVTSGIAATLGADGDCSWTESGLQITLASSAPLKNIRDKKLAVATFKCTVNANTAGSLWINTTTTSGGIENFGGVAALLGDSLTMLPASHIRLSGMQIKIVSATHTWSSTWTSDQNGHWYACSHCTEKGSYTAHVFENACDPDCATCGYTHQTQHALASGWTTNANSHWHVCSQCGLKLDEAVHEPGAAATATTAQTCTVCAYEIVPALDAEETMPPPASTEITTTPAVTDEYLDPSVTPEPSDPSASADQGGGDRSSFPLWILLVVAAVLVVVAVVLLVVPKKKSRS